MQVKWAHVHHRDCLRHARVNRTAQRTSLCAHHSRVNLGTLLGGGGNGDGGNRPPTKALGGSDSGGNQNSQPSWWMGCTLAAGLGLQSLVFASPAAAAKPVKHEEAQSQMQLGDIDTYIEQAWMFIGPALTKLGWSGLLGMAAASVIKFLGRALLTLVGFTFVVVQGLKYAGVLTEVRWGELLKHASRHLDPEGKKTSLEAEDLKTLAKKAMVALTAGVPSVGGFLAGFTLGIKFL